MLGQAAAPTVPLTVRPEPLAARPEPVAAPAPGTVAAPGGEAARVIQLSPDEAKLIIKVTQNIIAFSQSNPIEFLAYCPRERWKEALTRVGTWVQEIERQIKAGGRSVNVPADVVFHLVDLEKCVTAVRDARLASVRWAFALSAAGTIANLVFGLKWLTIPTYIGSLALLFGGPLMAYLDPEPQEPFKPSLAGRLPCRHRLGGECEMIAMKMKEEEKKNPDRRKVLERVVVSPNAKIQKHHWGTVKPRPGSKESAICLAKGRFRVRVEGWAEDVVIPVGDWEFADPEDCNGNIILAVWTGDRSTEGSGWGEISGDSGHERTYWVEYIGPLTDGMIRRAGPFGCTGDPVDHAKEDGGFSEPGVDGGYAIFDEEGNVVDQGM